METPENYESSQQEDFLSEISLNNIYLSLSENINTDFDLRDITDKLNSIMEEIYDKEFLLKPTDIIQSDQILINKSLILLIKETEKIKYKQYGIIFLTFCEYFDLDGNKTFGLLHEKIKNIIMRSTEMMIGKDIYGKAKKKEIKESIHNGIKIISIFDL
jgi:hypothetical protein